MSAVVMPLTGGHLEGCVDSGSQRWSRVQVIPGSRLPPSSSHTLENVSDLCSRNLFQAAHVSPPQHEPQTTQQWSPPCSVEDITESTGREKHLPLCPNFTRDTSRLSVPRSDLLYCTKAFSKRSRLACLSLTWTGVSLICSTILPSFWIHKNSTQFGISCWVYMHYMSLNLGIIGV